MLTGGNLARMMILGVIYLPLYLYSATYFAPILTGLANSTGAVEVEKGQLITWSTIETPELRIMFAEAFNGNILGIGGAVLFLALFVWLYKTMTAQEVPSKRYEN